MKRNLLICALLLTGIGAWAQGTAYVFNAEDWVALSDHSGTNVSYDTGNNTISVTYNTGSEAGLGNMTALNASDASTAGYTVTADQYWFVIKGTGLSTTGNMLWWMNGKNDGTWYPTETATLDGGIVVLAWDLSETGTLDMEEGTNYLIGFTCFGLIAEDTDAGFTITDINFYTEEEVDEMIVAEPYSFVATDWVALDPTGRAADADISYSNNTITVTKSGANNIALGNSTSYGKYGPITTAYKYVTKEQKWFVVIGTGLSTGTNDSYLWWLNGLNNGGSYAPSKTETLDDNRVLFAWDLSSDALSGINGNLQDEEVNHLDGWTGFGLTETSESATIYDINFYTEDELTAMIGASHFCEAIYSHWSIDPDPATEENGALFYVDQADKGDASGMTPPYMTYYMWEGNEANNYLPAAVISHETLTLEPGLYEVSMDIRIIDYDTDATVGEGTLFSANGVSQDIKLGVDANDGSYTEGTEHEDLYGTYTIYVQVEADNGGDTGSLDISLTIPEGATYNWISWKNLTVTAIENEPTVEWTLGADYGTLMLPFAANLSTGTNTSGLTAYTISSVSDNEVTLSEGTTSIEAGVPYIIGGTVSEEAITFEGVPTAYNVSYTGEDGYLTGVQKQTTAPAGSYVLQLQEGDETPAFYLVESDETITVGAYHCYLNYTAPAGAKLVVNFPDSGVATAVEAAETEEASGSGAVYDLSGRRVAKAQKGVYIVDGKKKVIK